MRYPKSKHPIGATWEAEYNGKHGTIWLAEINEFGMEVWRWSTAYLDGSGGNGDWALTYRSCRNQCPFPPQIKFKRINPRKG